MRITNQIVSAGSLGLILVSLLGCKRDDQPTTYTVPKEPAAATASQDPVAPPMTATDSTMPAADIPVSSAPIHWITPPSWQQLASTSIRIGNFAVPGRGNSKADVGIFSFPGTVGTELENVNRWRGELKLPNIEQSEISSEPVAIDGIEGKLYDIAGAKDRTVVATLPRNGAMWFFKMRGPQEIVVGAKPTFLDFLKSVHFSTPTPKTTATSADNAESGPQWTVPASWKEKQAGPMIFKSFSAGEENGKTAAVNISFFPGDVGGTLANVNRWRGQLGLSAVDDSGLGKVTQSLDTAGGQATLVDFSGTDAKTGQPARLIAAIVPHGANTWFYKLMGDGPVVENEKGNFVKFVQTAHYP